MSRAQGRGTQRTPLESPPAESSFDRASRKYDLDVMRLERLLPIVKLEAALSPHAVRGVPDHEATVMMPVLGSASPGPGP